MALSQSQLDDILDEFERTQAGRMPISSGVIPAQVAPPVPK